ncbi:DNA cytosine methyltransferase [Pseudomonas putida]|uniref:DNA cytosine methyltransferase n=1 Tax=Pseudomonas putida TaxID=303 RepID=UPI0009A1F0B4|nr:DNA cytosine methyltransferase [Pseudomonas putida]
MNSELEPPTIIDLFCGCGGFSLGAKLAGFDALVAVDIDPDIQSSYKKNYPLTRTLEGNVADITLSDWREIIGNRRPDGIIGGPPCQGFSRIGKRQKDDPRNSLIFHYFRHVKELGPKFFVMENVEGILDEDGIEILEAGMAQVSDIYTILGPFVINAADYGAPTNRYRVLVVGYRSDEMNALSLGDFEKGKVFAHTTVKQAISDLPRPISSSKENTYHWSEYSINPAVKISEYAKKMRKVPRVKGLGWKESLQKLRLGQVSGLAETKHTDVVAQRYASTPPGKADPISKSYRLAWEGLSPTLRAGTGSDKGSFQAVRPLHPEFGRVITVREAARLQGFPDWYVFHPTKWHSFRMIGNSVSPLVSFSVMSVILKAMLIIENKSAA